MREARARLRETVTENVKGLGPYLRNAENSQGVFRAERDFSGLILRDRGCSHPGTHSILMKMGNENHITIALLSLVKTSCSNFHYPFSSELHRFPDEPIAQRLQRHVCRCQTT